MDCHFCGKRCASWTVVSDIDQIKAPRPHGLGSGLPLEMFTTTKENLRMEIADNILSVEMLTATS